jgi:hypothetical protein
LRHYFQAHRVVVVTAFPLKAILHNSNATGNIAKWAAELAEFQLEFQARHVVKSQVHGVLYTLPSGVFSGGHRTSDHRLQGYGWVVAPKARQDILDYRPTEPAALGLQAGTKNLVQASEMVGGGV